MTDKEKKRHLAYEALVIMGMLAFLTFICRLWPILLLIILGIFIAAIRLLFLSSKKVEVLTIPPIQDERKKPPTALSSQQKEITVNSLRNLFLMIFLSTC